MMPVALEGKREVRADVRPEETVEVVAVLAIAEQGAGRMAHGVL
jgi:hypothetical protein